MKTSYKKSLLILVLLTVCSLIVGCSKKTIEPVSKTSLFMGTVVKITVYDNSDMSIIDKAFDRISEIEDEVSINKEGTELDIVNSNAGSKPISVSDDTFNIIQKGIDYTKLSDGYFDITIGPLVKLWSIGLPEAKVPTSDEIKEKLKLIDINFLKLNEDAKSIFLKSPNMLIDLGGIAKGYTADEVAKVLLDSGVKSAIIDLGGNIYCLGNKNKKPWNVGIQDPFTGRGEMVGKISVENKSIVTSGIYERYIEDNGKKYHHILSPFDGYPFDNDLAGISIISSKSVDGDALSTAVFAKGLDDGMKFVESLDNIDAIFITKDKKIYLSSGIKDNFELTNTDFKICNK